MLRLTESQRVMEMRAKSPSRAEVAMALTMEQVDNPSHLLLHHQVLLLGALVHHNLINRKKLWSQLNERSHLIIYPCLQGPG
jgi:hypothetical protein